MRKVLILTPGFAQTCEEALEILRQDGLTPVFQNDVPISREEEILPYLDDTVEAIVVGVEPAGKLVQRSAKNLKWCPYSEQASTLWCWRAPRRRVLR